MQRPLLYKKNNVTTSQFFVPTDDATWRDPLPMVIHGQARETSASDPMVSPEDMGKPRGAMIAVVGREEIGTGCCTTEDEDEHHGGGHRG